MGEQKPLSPSLSVQIALLFLSGQHVSWGQARPKKKLAPSHGTVAQQQHTTDFFQQKVSTGVGTQLPVPTAFRGAKESHSKEECRIMEDGLQSSLTGHILWGDFSMNPCAPCGWRGRSKPYTVYFWSVQRELLTEKLSVEMGRSHLQSILWETAVGSSSWEIC